MSNNQNLMKFSIFWIVQMLFIVSSHIILSVSSIWFALKYDPAQLPIIGMYKFFYMIPILVIIPIAGTLVDKWDKKKIILFSGLFQAVITFCFIVIITWNVIMPITLLILLNIKKGIFLVNRYVDILNSGESSIFLLFYNQTHSVKSRFVDLV